MSPKHYFKRYKKIKKWTFRLTSIQKSISKSLSIHASFCICCVSYPFCSVLTHCFERLFLCFTQCKFGGSQSRCLNCHEFHDTSSLSPHLTLTFHNLGPRNLKDCLAWGVEFSPRSNCDLFVPLSINWSNEIYVALIW